MHHRHRLRAAVVAAIAISPFSAEAGERRLEIQDEAAADSEIRLKLRGTLHVDGRYLGGEDPGGAHDGWQATRVRPIFEGTIGGIYDFKFMPDFGQGRTVVQDAYVTARFHPAFQLTVGKFKPPVGLERLQSANDIRFVARAFPTGLAPNRDIGIELGGDLAGGRLSYAVALLNGSNDGSSSETCGDVDLNDDKEYAARLFVQPFAESENFAIRGLGFGVAATYTDQTGDVTQPLLPSFRTPGQSTFFRYRSDTIADGERRRLAPQFYYYVGRLGVLGEYTEVSQDVSRLTSIGLREETIDTNAWQLAASVFLTGEEAAYRGFRPKTAFSPADGTWGAFEIVARVQRLEVDDAAFELGTNSFADPATAAREATSWGVGINWYLNDNLKWMLDYERTRFDDGSSGGDREDEDAVLVRFALGF